jgi:DNA-binding transcriptional ArsR family regulator
MAQSRTTLDPAAAIIAALAQLGQTTAADIATVAGVAYSTTTRNLRELAAAGRVEKVADGKQSQWRLPTTASPHAGAEAGTEAGAQLGTHAHTDADTQAGIPADTTVAEATDRATDAAAATDHGADNAATDDSGPDDADPDDSAPSRADQVEDAVRADRTDDVGAGEAPAYADTDTDAAGLDSTDAPDGAATDGGPAATTPAQPGATAKPRRASGTLDGAVLDILEAHPDRAFKVSEVCKLIDAANPGQDVSKASPGAVVLACQRLVTKGKAILAVEKPATFQLVPADTAAVAGLTTSATGR